MCIPILRLTRQKDLRETGDWTYGGHHERRLERGRGTLERWERVCRSNESEERGMGRDEALDGGERWEELGRFGGCD